jgi:hypothetical protein
VGIGGNFLHISEPLLPNRRDSRCQIRPNDSNKLRGGRGCSGRYLGTAAKPASTSRAGQRRASPQGNCAPLGTPARVPTAAFPRDSAVEIKGLRRPRRFGRVCVRQGPVSRARNATARRDALDEVRGYRLRHAVGHARVVALFRRSAFPRCATLPVQRLSGSGRPRARSSRGSRRPPGRGTGPRAP